MKDLTGRAIVFLADGMADEPSAELNGKTPLQAVETPFMDSIAANGASGTFLTLPEGFPTSSDAANMSVLGYDLATFYPGRGPIECTSQGIELAPDDVAWRCNLIFVDSNGVLRDYSAGHISPEDAAVLMADLETAFGSDEVTFYSGVSYRNLLVLHGKRFSPLVDYFKPDSSQDILLSELRLSAQTPEAQETVDFLIDLEERAAKFLANHPINLKKKSPANRIWPWSPGRRPALPDFSQKYQQRTGAIISAVDVIRGLGMCSNMQVIEVPGATGFVDTNYDGKAQAAIKAIEEKDFVYLHLEAIDECSHLGDLKLKIQAIEEFDAKIVAPVLAALEGKGIRFAVLPDHPVPIKLRAHTTTPVPVAMMGPGIDVDGIESFSETLAPQGGLGYMSGDGLMKRLLGL